ncbi:rhomboid family protein [Daejeonella oryzae]|uniref:rhomboid family protein n=1 Tax=Daejeonella oryzae TaxID=1122943 RepID=UPI00047ED456|nr:rhomboid family intramembrane serine protease [Daejeonella oryzae]
MNRSVFSELYYKVFQSGNRLFLFIGINVMVFVAIGLIAVGEFLFNKSTTTTDLIVRHIAMPAYLPKLAPKFWTIITYMFGHQKFFHILFNMLWLYWLGRIFLDFLNQKQFTFLYFAGGIAGALFFITAYYVFPAFQDEIEYSSLLGASASVMAIVVATATLLPDYTISMLLLGPVRLKYIALVYVLLDILAIAGANPGGSIAHLGGAFIGFLYIKQLRAGNDWSKMFLKKRKLTVVKKADTAPVKRSNLPDQDIIDTILDKISKSGYESLSKKEKEQLFNASKKE